MVSTVSKWNRPRAHSYRLNNLLRFDWSSRARYLHNCPLASFCLQPTTSWTKQSCVPEAIYLPFMGRYLHHFIQNPSRTLHQIFCIYPNSPAGLTKPDQIVNKDPSKIPSQISSASSRLFVNTQNPCEGTAAVSRHVRDINLASVT